MIIGTGIDIVETQRISRIIDKWGTAFAKKILANNEWAIFQTQYQQSPQRAVDFLAKRFAAKEACAKAFGTGFRDGLAFTHIVISNDSLGKPQLSFRKQAKILYQQQQINHSHLSLSDEKNSVVAMVILER